MNGNRKLLKGQPVGLFCSVKCPGSLILKTYDLVIKWRNEGQPVVSGFHSPMEKECLNILLTKPGKAIICPARGMRKRLPASWKASLIDGRLLIVSPFAPHVQRATAVQSLQRNILVGKLADSIFVSHAEPGGKLEMLCRDWIGQGIPVYTFSSEYNQNLLELNAIAMQM